MLNAKCGLVNEFRFGKRYNRASGTMKQDLQMRIIVEKPLSGVTMCVQRGRDELLPPAIKTSEKLVFEFTISVDTVAGTPNFLGKYAQGPKDARFVYVNSGTYAREHHSCWGRRAKVSLMSITAKQVTETLSTPTAIVETSFAGVGRDGGPTCASVKGIEWRVVK
ncbi:MAG: DUF5990 family protein [Pyrinomonadaceae bacterium]